MAKKKKLKDRVWRKRFQLEQGGEIHDEDDLTGRVEQRGHNLDIYVDGFGTKTMQPGHGPIATLDLWDSVFKLHVWSNINQEDPTHSINLEGALETRRSPTEEEIEEAWQSMCRNHIQPSRLFAIGTGLIEQNEREAKHFSSCKQCERVLRAYQETMK